MRQVVDSVARARYFAWRRQFPSEAEDPIAAWEAAYELAFKAGAAYATRSDAELARDLGQIQSLLSRLDEHVTRYAEREVEDGSAYWRSEP